MTLDNVITLIEQQNDTRYDELLLTSRTRLELQAVIYDADVIETEIKIKLQNANYLNVFKSDTLYNVSILQLYNGYGQTDFKLNDWKDISNIPNAITELNIGTQVPDIFKISTVTGGGKELKMGDYKGSFDINGRAMSLEAKGAVLQ